MLLAHKIIYVVSFQRKSPGKSTQTLIKLGLHSHSQIVNCSVLLEGAKLFLANIFLKSSVC